jgi:hypothetical protein
MSVGGVLAEHQEHERIVDRIVIEVELHGAWRDHPVAQPEEHGQVFQPQQ